MTTKIWGELDARLSAIKRYNLFRTIQTQTVAEHVFNVERMAIRIAKEWFGVSDPQLLFLIMKWAHHHEDTEALSGDFPAMAKPYFKEAEFEADHEKVLRVKKPSSSFIRIVVKLADLMDCYNFFAMENALGNRHCEHHLTAMQRRIEKYVRNNCPEVIPQTNDWVYNSSNPRSDTYLQNGWSEEK